MNIGIIGLGLIGGSIAKAIKENTEHKVYGDDLQEAVLRKAILLEAIDDRLTDENLKSCHMIIIALYPDATIRTIEEKAESIGKQVTVIDCCGVKRRVFDRIQLIAEKNDFLYVGGHPMAGIEYSGFTYSQKALFRNASMILTPPVDIDIAKLEELKKFWIGLGFNKVVITTPEKHDRLIAYTSQLAHILSSAYVKSPCAEEHIGYSAGSYKDMTRVARLNADMWTELFLLNGDNLINEIDGLIMRLTEYKRALADSDKTKLYKLLQDGNKRKINLG